MDTLSVVLDWVHRASPPNSPHISAHSLLSFKGDVLLHQSSKEITEFARIDVFSLTCLT